MKQNNLHVILQVLINYVQIARGQILEDISLFGSAVPVSIITKAVGNIWSETLRFISLSMKACPLHQ